MDVAQTAPLSNCPPYEHIPEKFLQNPLHPPLIPQHTVAGTLHYTQTLVQPDKGKVIALSVNARIVSLMHNHALGKKTSDVWSLRDKTLLQHPSHSWSNSTGSVLNPQAKNTECRTSQRPNVRYLGLSFRLSRTTQSKSKFLMRCVALLTEDGRVPWSEDSRVAATFPCTLPHGVCRQVPVPNNLTLLHQYARAAQLVGMYTELLAWIAFAK